MKKIEPRTGTDPDEQLRMDIEAWIARHGLSATRFGRDALGQAFEARRKSSSPRTERLDISTG